MASSWKLKQPKPLCPSTTADNSKRNTPIQWDVSRGDDDKNNSSRSFTVYTPSNFCSGAQQQQEEDVPLRILLAIHGYGGKPTQEIRKWQVVADSLNSIIIAPMGTETIESHRLGWNAVECCGDPVVNEIDDFDFVIHGVMELFLNQFIHSSSSSSISSIGRNKRAHVITTGFSNGGFFTSLLGLSKNRPEWLVGIVPTGGYQYDTNAYSNTHQPLAVFMHHGGRDSVVNPDGCCFAKESKQRKNGSKSNCNFDIGVKQETCQSIHSVFHLWSRINGCSSSDNYGSRSIKEENGDNSVESECFKGNDCIEPTNFCMWTNEGHSWGIKFPGIEMVHPWMKDVFARAEAKSLEHSDETRDIDILSSTPTTQGHPLMGKSIFLSATLILLGFIVLRVSYLFLKHRNFIRRSHKRKNSEVQLEKEMMALSQENEMEEATSTGIKVIR